MLGRPEKGSVIPRSVAIYMASVLELGAKIFTWTSWLYIDVMLQDFIASHVVKRGKSQYENSDITGLLAAAFNFTSFYHQKLEVPKKVVVC